MVFESLINPRIAEEKPWVTFFLGLLYPSFAIFLGLYIFSESPSLSIVFLTTFFFIPLFYRTMLFEEKKDKMDEFATEKSLLREHSKVIYFCIYLFLGLMLSFTFWYILFSSTTFLGTSSENVFELQLGTIQQINGKATEANLHASLYLFSQIFQNNIKVMIFCILFSFIFGSGAIFILTWNASVIGVALGRYIITTAAGIGGGAGTAYLMASGCGITRYMIHGIPEIAGYFIAGLAGGIISAALIKHDFGTDKFEKIMLDASFLLIISVVILLFGALVESFITPAIMCRI
jgi:uncharacterized membrane protein SpoIIM required for sporulation